MSDSRRTIRLGISTCPNDTFAFHAILNELIELRGIDFEIELLDIQALNDRLFRSEFDVAKASFHAALLLADRTLVLPSGSALGFGVGPLLLARRDGIVPQNSSQLTLCPGAHTTATLLFRLFYPSTSRIEQTVFSQIMPRLRAGTADFGVCIHEGRFTWQDQGLSCVADLGEIWEAETKLPLPLGGLLVDRSLDDEIAARVQETIAESIEFALNDPASALPTMRRYAQEFDDDVLMQHVDLYVNEWTRELGSVGTDALRKLSELGKRTGISGEALRVWGL